MKFHYIVLSCVAAVVVSRLHVTCASVLSMPVTFKEPVSTTNKVIVNELDLNEDISDELEEGEHLVSYEYIDDQDVTENFDVLVSDDQEGEPEGEISADEEIEEDDNVQEADGEEEEEHDDDEEEEEEEYKEEEDIKGVDLSELSDGEPWEIDGIDLTKLPDEELEAYLSALDEKFVGDIGKSLLNNINIGSLVFK